MGLYLHSGYLNQKWIDETADKHNINFIIEIGARQVGKTYGTLQLQLQENRHFILMRRTQTETDFICNEINNPFTAYKDYTVTVKKDTKYTGAIYRHESDSDPEYIGALMALSTIAKIRGFNGSLYSDLVFDEFIPENHVTKIKEEGDAFLNAITTISGAREENGERPLKVWLLANANTLNSPILQALNIAEHVEKMSVNQKEISILENRGIMIILPVSEQIVNKRKKNALARAVGGVSKFSRMAYDNDFSYNDYSDIVRSVNLKEYTLRLIVCDIGIYRHKSKFLYYCTPFIVGSVESARHFYDTPKDRVMVRKTFTGLLTAYLNKVMFFSDQTCKAKILDIIYF